MTTEINIKGNLIEVDLECVDMVNFFNENNLNTRFSCSGHGTKAFEIMFESNVSDEDIKRLLENFENKYTHSPFIGRFMKWQRKMNGEIVSNWIYIANNIAVANSDLQTMKEQMKIK